MELAEESMDDDAVLLCPSVTPRFTLCRADNALRLEVLLGRSGIAFFVVGVSGVAGVAFIF